MNRRTASTENRQGRAARSARAVALCVAALAAALSVGMVAAGDVTVHRWVDEQGVTHFSDTPPRAAVRSERWEVTVSAPDTDPATAYYSVANQWRRLSRERDAREARRLERRYLDAVTRTPAAPRGAPVHPAGAFAVPLGPFSALNVPPRRRPGWSHRGRHRQPPPPVVQPAPAASFHVAGPGRAAQAARALRRSGASSGTSEQLGGRVER